MNIQEKKKLRHSNQTDTSKNEKLTKENQEIVVQRQMNNAQQHRTNIFDNIEATKNKIK